MARFLIDTSVVIDFANAREPGFSLVNTLMQSTDEVGTCAIVVAEFFTGLAPSHHQTWHMFFAGLDYWHIDSAVAMRAGQYRYTFARRGIALSLPDTMIAAVAASENATLVTANDRDFPMADISILVP
jgi:predicted nucleic acid-binding protein